MHSEKGYSLPAGMKVRRKDVGDIIEKDHYSNDRYGAGFYYMTPSGRARGLFRDDEWEFIEEEKERLPKHGDEIEVRTYSTEKEWEIKTVSHTALITTDGKPYALGQWRYPPKKTELTLEEVEERLGIEKGSLIIIN